MQAEQLTNPKPMGMIQSTMKGPLMPGQMGILMAHAGTGKTACLTHIAIEHLLKGQSVLHVCVDDVPEKVKVWYRELLKHMTNAQPDMDLAGLQHRIEPLRFILAYLHHTFSPEKMAQSLNDLKEQANFTPSVVVIDGLNFDQLPRETLVQLKEFAFKYHVSLWMSARTHRHISQTNEHGIPYPGNESDDLFEAIVLLEPAPDRICVKVLKYDGHYQPEHPDIFLDPVTFLVRKN